MTKIVMPNAPTTSERLDSLELRFSLLGEVFSKRVAELDNAVLNLSQALAEKEHGAHLVSLALGAAHLEKDRLKDCLKSGHPYDALVEWYQTEMAS